MHREQFVPDSVVVMKVEEGTVHVEEDGIDLVPVDQSGPFKRLMPLADMIRTLSRADATGYRLHGMSHRPLPEILASRLLARSRLFSIEELTLRFSNGVERVYERLPVRGHPGVIVVALNERREIMLIREYAAGFHEVQLSLPKGAAHIGETLEYAADRELKEEIGFGARHVEFVKRVTLAPGHMGFTINIMFAKDLYPEQLPGDEPEPIEVVPWPLDRLDELIRSPDFNEARAIAALTLTRELMEKA